MNMLDSKDIVISFGQYMATNAEALLKSLEGLEITNPDGVGDLDGYIDHVMSLRSSIYQFQKRVARLTSDMERVTRLENT